MNEPTTRPAALVMLDDDLEPALPPSSAETTALATAAGWQSLVEAQRAILNGQQATRDLIGVIVQDNFSLKEENQRLRDRMLSLERDLTELRRRDEARREATEARLQAAEAAVNTLLEQLQRLQAQMRALNPPRPLPGERQRGWLNRLLGD